MRLLRVMLGLLLATSGSVISARALGSTHPAPALAAWFTQADGKPCAHPCLFGLEPEITPCSEIITLVGAHTSTRAFRSVGTHFEGATFLLMVDCGLDGKISYLSIAPAERFSGARLPFSAGDVIRVLGQPDMVYTRPLASPSFAALIYVRCSLIIWLPNSGVYRRLDPYTRFYFASMVPHTGMHFLPGQPGLRVWRGFGMGERYVNRAPLYERSAESACAPRQ